MTAHLRVLYVDDEPLQLRAFSRSLRREPYEVVVSTDPRQALMDLALKPADILVSDWKMPGLNGIEFLEQAQALVPDAPRILITAHAELDTVLDAINRVSVSRFVRKPWTPAELRQTMRQTAEKVVLQRENARLNELLLAKTQALEEVNQRLEELVHSRTTALLDGLVLALDYRDTETQWHSRRVAEYSALLAETLGLSGQVLRDVEWGALLHDIGKIGIPDHILLKPAKLSEAEWEVMRLHPALGYELLCGIDFLTGAAAIVQQHHERFDGEGYPSGVVGDDIVVGARVFSVIDTFDALTSDRPYRKAQDYSVARDEIRRVSAHQLDPRVVEAFLDIDPARWQAIRDQIGGQDFHDRTPPPVKTAQVMRAPSGPLPMPARDGNAQGG